MQCCHNDGNPANNRLDNLRWDTPKANCADKWAHGTMLRGEQIQGAKLTESDVREIRKLVKAGETRTGVAAIYGMHQTTIGKICAGKKWKHVR
jgi:hypothetical protein